MTLMSEKLKKTAQKLSFENEVFLISVVIFVASLVSLVCPPFSDFEQARLAILKNPVKPDGYLALAETAVSAGDWKVAQKELIKSEAFWKKPHSEKAITRLNKIKKEAYSQAYLQTAIGKWLRYIKQQPGYRDAYLQISVLYFRLGEIKSAKIFWKKAFELDPNNKKVTWMGKIIEREIKAELRTG